MSEEVPFHQAISVAREQHWAAIAPVLKWADAVGRSIDPDPLALLLVAKSRWLEYTPPEPEPEWRWTREAGLIDTM